MNENIRALEVRLIDEKGGQAGIVGINEALQKAEEARMDLVEISPNAKPPVCKIMDYGKHIFQLSKKQSLSKKSQKRIQTKRLRIRPTIEEGDYQVKRRNLIRLINEGNKVEVSLRFRGREAVHQEIGLELLIRLKNDLVEETDVEREPEREGRQMIMVLVPKKK